MLLLPPLELELALEPQLELRLIPLIWRPARLTSALLARPLAPTGFKMGRDLGAPGSATSLALSLSRLGFHLLAD